MSTTSASYFRRSSAFSAAFRTISSTVRSRPDRSPSDPAPGGTARSIANRRPSRFTTSRASDDVVPPQGRVERPAESRRDDPARAVAVQEDLGPPLGPGPAGPGQDHRDELAGALPLDDREPRARRTSGLRRAGPAAARPRSAGRRPPRCRPGPARGLGSGPTLIGGRQSMHELDVGPSSFDPEWRRVAGSAVLRNPGTSQGLWSPTGVAEYRRPRPPRRRPCHPDREPSAMRRPSPPAPLPGGRGEARRGMPWSLATVRHPSTGAGGNPAGQGAGVRRRREPAVAA